MRLLILAALINSTAPALADVQFQRFFWKADNTVDVQFVVNKVVLTAKGELRDGQTVELSAGTVKLSVISFSNTFVALAFVEEGRDAGQVIILERWNAQYVPLTAMISGQGADLTAAVTGLREANKWDHSLALRSLVNFIAVNPGRTLADFNQAVKDGLVKGIAKPLPRNQVRTVTKREPLSEVKEPSPEVARPPRTPKTDGWAPEVKREPAPARPPRIEGWVPEPRREYDPRYPGRNMERPIPERRKPKTLFDLLNGN